MAQREAVQLDRARIAELTAREETKLNERTKGSQELFQRARRSLAGGVPSSYHLRDPSTATDTLQPALAHHGTSSKP